jgi:outer membrane protein assembly factor BamA
MRGGDFYEKIGTKYFLTNLEFRFPLIKYFALGWPLPIRISNIGGALFTDIGSAWYVNSHFKGIEKLSSGRHHLDDIFLGYGLGARLNLGIFILKFDMGWNTDFVENSSKPKYYFSLGPGF